MKRIGRVLTLFRLQHHLQTEVEKADPHCRGAAEKELLSRKRTTTIKKATPDMPAKMAEELTTAAMRIVCRLGFSASRNAGKM